LRALALEIQNRYDLMLKLDLDPEDADVHRELLDLANEALEDIAMAEAGWARSADAGSRSGEVRPSPKALWAECRSVPEAQHDVAADEGWDHPAPVHRRRQALP
jgi:hypothetical protein